MLERGRTRIGYLSLLLLRDLREELIAFITSSVLCVTSLLFSRVVAFSGLF